jgi:hypothetical protein
VEEYSVREKPAEDIQRLSIDEIIQLAIDKSKQTEKVQCYPKQSISEHNILQPIQQNYQQVF